MYNVHIKMIYVIYTYIYSHTYNIYYNIINIIQYIFLYIHIQIYIYIYICIYIIYIYIYYLYCLLILEHLKKLSGLFIFYICTSHQQTELLSPLSQVYPLTFLRQRSLSYRNQSIDLFCKSLNWFFCMFGTSAMKELIEAITLPYQRYFIDLFYWQQIND